MRAVVLVNLGTPDAPEAGAIRRYLRQFLSDPRVVSLPRWLWLPLLHLVILNVRPARLVGKYRLVWGTKDGPLRNITRALVRRVAGRVAGQVTEPQRVEMAMTYGMPSIKDTVEQLTQAGVDQILFLPLFPQYASATTGAIEDQVASVMQDLPDIKWQLVKDYHDNAAYIDAVAQSIGKSLAFRRKQPLVVFSFHGIPQAVADAGDPYPQQCEATAAAIAKSLGLADNAWRLTYQSRFGPAAWLRPYTDETMAALPGEGVTDVLVVCPGFSADCLETIEEIRVLNRNIFLQAGGVGFTYIKALNASWLHADAIAGIIDSHPI
ncbi:MAG: ferrochelatase [Pseudomonadales bacterium]